jgi:hypothetical protein
VVLSARADEGFLPLVKSFVENSALCFGLGRDEVLGLKLAAEEVFVHLCRVVMPGGGPLQIHCSGGGYYVRTVFSFQTDAFDMRGFNLTASVSVEEDADLCEMGLVIASRSVERFQLNREKGGGLRLILIKEKSYPRDPEDSPAVCRPLSEFSLREPRGEEIKFVTHLARSCYSGAFLPDFFLYPGKVADMVATDEYHAIAAFGPSGEIGGAVLWHEVGRSMVECFGPYLFGQPAHSSLPEALQEACIGAIARTDAVGLINTCPTPELPVTHFERLGTLTVRTDVDGAGTDVQAWFRLMREDAGSAVWVHLALLDFVQRQYRRLVLPREIRHARNSGEHVPKHSVLAAEFDRLQGRVTLRPMWPGMDARDNIAQHLRLLVQEGMLNIVFAMDLGQSWQAELAPVLLGLRFEPRCVLPYAGQGDVVLFQFCGESS